MSQDFTDDSYDPDHVADTDMDNQETNDLALKSLFSGAAAPSNRVAGMPWHDTVNGLIKVWFGGVWVTVFDLSNEYVLAALLATNLSRSILAGAGLSGGGVLNANRTLTHAPHTGDVTGTTALTIPANAITPTKISHGSLQVLSDGAVYEVLTESWKTKCGCYIKCPSAPTVLRMYAEFRNRSTGATLARLNVSGIGVSAGSTVDEISTFTLKDCGSVSMAAANPGSLYLVEAQAVLGNDAKPGDIRRISVWWE